MGQPNRVISHDYWFKVVGMLQQNWALIENSSADGCRVYFINDIFGVFDELEFANTATAQAALFRNGFSRFKEDKKAQQFLTCPNSPYLRRPHPNGPIYSSGRYWR